MQQGISLLLSFIVVSTVVLTKPVIEESNQQIRKSSLQSIFNIHKRMKREDDTENVKFSFNCKGRAMGFYADQEYNCQYFHMCDGEGHRIPYVCANETSFNQEFRICDWEYNFDCAEANKWYYLNELTYATESQDEDDDDDDEDEVTNRKS